MSEAEEYSSDVAFTPAVKEVQSRKGSRALFEEMERDGGWRTLITGALQTFIEAQRSIFLATANAQGQPYIQHRGGPPGFLKVLNERTIGMADFAGNQQYITLGNLSENPKAHIFLVDFAARRRIKLWGTMRVVEDDAELMQALMPRSYRARGSQALLFTLSAWDVNCSQHIPQRFEAEEVRKALAERDARIAALEAELVRLKARVGGDPAPPAEG